MMERWKPVIGREGEYEVSTLGRVRSLTRIKVYQRVDQYSGNVLTVRRTHRGRVLRPARSKSGHMTVALGRGETEQVHALVLEAFVGPCPDGQESLHKDGIPSNNVLANLRWGTRSENIKDAIRHGARGVGEKHKQAKLKNSDIPAIRELFGKLSYCKIARRYGVSDASIRQIKDGKTWKHA